MRKSLKLKIGAVASTFAMAGALAVAASGTTGAYFSDTKTGGITGTIGAVHLSTSEMTFAWTNVMPGEPQKAIVDFTNTGTGPQDFFILFPNRPALHALNQLGSYGEVHVTGGKSGAIVPLFDSMNLQDGRHGNTANPAVDGVYNSCGNVFTPSGCWPLPVNIKIASGVTVGGTGTVTFGFNYAGKLGDPTIANPGRYSGGGVFNSYPLMSYKDSNNALDTIGNASAGMPYEIVAVQVGQQP